jgi:hypothetical protein
MLCPRQTEVDSPTRMNHREQFDKCLVMKDTSENLKLTIIIAKSISMGYKELLAVNLTSIGGAMQDNSTFFLQVISAPDIMIAREEMYLHAQVRKFGYFS